MDYPIHVAKISMKLSILYFRGHKSKFLLPNRADPDEMLPYAASHLGLHCLPKFLITDIQDEKS